MATEKAQKGGERKGKQRKQRENNLSSVCDCDCARVGVRTDLTQVCGGGALGERGRALAAAKEVKT